MKRPMLLLVSAALILFGCKKEAAPEKAPEPPPEPVAAAPAEPEELELPELSPDSPTTELGELPVAEDLEAEAEATVAIENLESELDRLEAEIVDS